VGLVGLEPKTYGIWDPYNAVSKLKSYSMFVKRLFDPKFN
jgi:hypothetical protein